ncbi:MAG: DUF4382 domain-containing protein [Thaumarchaeota archaeon]|nr:DUF4382 domain-containing protein [Nitrososphaerota archaeon]
MKTSGIIAVGVLLLIVIAGIGAYAILSRPMGTLNIRVTDAPTPGLTNLYLTVSDISLQNEANSTVNFNVNASEFDLLQLTNVTMLLGSNSIPAGNYTMIRFNVTTATATINGENVSLKVPSGELKVSVHPHIQVQSGKTTTVVLDMTADMTNISTSYNLTPHVNVKEVTGPG